ALSAPALPRLLFAGRDPAPPRQSRPRQGRRRESPLRRRPSRPAMSACLRSWAVLFAALFVPLAAGAHQQSISTSEIIVRCVRFIDTLAAGHTHLASITLATGQISQRVASESEPGFEVESRVTFLSAAGRFLLLGIEHIFTGYDHIAFLLGLLLLGGTFRELVKVVTAFTVAHSLTLALATLEVARIGPRIVEPLIAASIVYVAVENLWALRSEAPRAAALRHRWLLTLGFGFVHGFGFADALQKLHLPRSGIAAALFTFNLGVEVGQLCIVAAAFPLLSR